MDIKNLMVLTIILSAVMLATTFAFGYALYHEIHSQVTIELKAKENSQ